MTPRFRVIELLRALRGTDGVRLSKPGLELLDTAISELEKAPLTASQIQELFTYATDPRVSVAVDFARKVERFHGIS
jgi:hypothetical protein